MSQITHFHFSLPLSGQIQSTGPETSAQIPLWKNSQGEYQGENFTKKYFAVFEG